mmetsp:Transcript_131923/g.329009  ORF Transcript_131923/g.329009 Transcript_131923/m.329009 type:complete len:137 (-) Transcript_131923:104-514(-)
MSMKHFQCGRQQQLLSGSSRRRKPAVLPRALIKQSHLARIPALHETGAGQSGAYLLVREQAQLPFSNRAANTGLVQCAPPSTLRVLVSAALRAASAMHPRSVGGHRLRELVGRGATGLGRISSDMYPYFPASPSDG